MDEHRSFRGRLFRCFRVFGGLNQLGVLSERQRIDGVVVTISTLPEERWVELIDETKAHGLKLYRWGPGKDFELVEGASNPGEDGA